MFVKGRLRAITTTLRSRGHGEYLEGNRSRYPETLWVPELPVVEAEPNPEGNKTGKKTGTHNKGYPVVILPN